LLFFVRLWCGNNWLLLLFFRSPVVWIIRWFLVLIIHGISKKLATSRRLYTTYVHFTT
jgi:hypothetical protein